MDAVEEVEPLAIVGVHSCGALVFASTDDPERMAENAKGILKLVRKGYLVDRITCQQVREAKWCKCNRKAKK